MKGRKVSNNKSALKAGIGMKFPQGMDIERKSVKIGSSEPGNEAGKLAITIRSQS
jgi:hypothetical protein